MVVRLLGHFWQEFLPLLLVIVSKPKLREINSCQNGGKNFGKPVARAVDLSVRERNYALYVRSAYLVQRVRT